MDEARAEYVAGLRALADLFEQRPDLALPLRYSRMVRLYTLNEEDYRHEVRALGGRREKWADEHYIGVLRDLGGGVGVKIYAERDEMCTRRQVGTTTVLQPDPDVEVPMVEVEVPEYEYDCASVLDGEREAVNG